MRCPCAAATTLTISTRFDSGATAWPASAAPVPRCS
jgi:hypothetical protein